MNHLSDEEVRRRALKAAAKVALAMSTASIFGACGGAVQNVAATNGEAGHDDVDASTNETGDASITIDHPVPDAVVDATACNVTPDAATPDQLACCSAEVKGTFPGDISEPIDGGTYAPDLVACCAEIIKAYDGVHDLGLTFGQARACCYVLPPPWYSHGGAACTPWGPPMPPPMPRSEQDDEVIS